MDALLTGGHSERIDLSTVRIVVLDGILHALCKPHRTLTVARSVLRRASIFQSQGCTIAFNGVCKRIYIARSTGQMQRQYSRYFVQGDQPCASYLQPS